MNREGYWRSFLICLPLAGCQGEDAPATVDVAAVCSSACAQASTDCDLQRQEIEYCEDVCDTRYSSYPAACREEADRALTCTRDAVWSCYGTIEPLGCDEYRRSYQACLEANMPSAAWVYCAKCRTCYEEDSEFYAPFCAGFWNGGSFDPKCSNESDILRINDKLLSQEEINGMSCEEFASRI